MNRRRFIQSLAAAVSLPAAPALSLQSVTTTIPAAAAVPTKARFWAIYMSALHGECTPLTLQNVLNIPAAEARKYLGHLVAEGIIKPNPLLQKSVSRFVNPGENSPLERARKRSNMKAQAEPEEVEIRDATDAAECPDTEYRDAEAELPEDIPEADPADADDNNDDDDPVEVETRAPNETEIQA